MALTLLLLIFLAPAESPEVPPRPKEVPKDAQLLVPTPMVRIYHWTRAEGAGGRVSTFVFPVIDEWPEKTWGAEIVMTPQPFCCGAKKTQLRWRQSQPLRPTTIGYLTPGSSYQLNFQFQSTQCNCHQ